jgi:adenine-specific DNA-methyltransferase
VIKYLGSKRRLVPVLGAMFTASGARTALDLFTGTTRVAQELKRRGGLVTTVDTARYSEVFARCYIETDATTVDHDALAAGVARLDALDGRPGYFTDTFCRASRYLQPENGARVDAVRAAIGTLDPGSPLVPILLTSLIEAADRVDSTVGVQMAYLKQWAPRAHQRLTLRVPELLEGTGTVHRGDAVALAGLLGPFDLAYLDPPYNQHRYFTNYHVWETLVASDEPEHYGIACKRVDARDDTTKSAFNRKREMPEALAACIDEVDARLLILSYNDESWITLGELHELCARRGHVVALAFDSARYVGAQIGVHNPAGERVGEVSHLRNLEYLLVCGERAHVEHVTAPYADAVAAAATPTRRSSDRGPATTGSPRRA